MRDVVNSLVSVSWGVPLLAAQQLHDLFADHPSRAGVTPPLDDVTGEARRRLGRDSSRSFTLFERLQGEVAGAARQAMDLGLFQPEFLPRLADDVTRRARDGAGVVLAGNAPAAARELLNKGAVFLLVRGVARLIGIPAQRPLPIERLVGNSYRLGDFPALWAIEGLGHDWPLSYSNDGVLPRGLLTSARAQQLPRKASLMLHAGLGLWAAELQLEGATLDTPRHELARRVREALRLDRDNARAEEIGPAYESLGLETRLFFPVLTDRVDEIVREVAPEARDYFWHGAGRAVYFSPVNFLPCSTWQNVVTARREAPGERGRLNAVAGLAWAVNLVNQRQPWILDELLVRPHGDALARDDAFADGVASSIAMRAATTPGASFIASFLDYRPSPASRRRWDELVRIPGETALDLLPRLQREDALGEIFRYGSWQRYGGLRGGGGRRGWR